MKILIIGGNGTIGKTVVAHFKENNQIIIAGRSNSDVNVDIVDSKSIKAMFEQIGKRFQCFEAETYFTKIIVYM